MANKLMEFCDQSWNFTNFALNFTKSVPFFADIGKFGISLECLHFPTFPEKSTINAKLVQRDGHGKS